MKHKLLVSTALFAIAGLCGLNLAQPVVATNDSSETIVGEETKNSAKLWLGQNLLLAGNNLVTNEDARGLLFSAGNQLDLNTKSDYAFVAGNIINYSAETEKDLFLAGNAITILPDAKVGRDVFATGNNITVETDLPGSLAFAGSKITIKDIKIDGNVDLAVDRVVFEGDVEIAGKLRINEDATITGLDKVSYHEVEKYEIVRYEITATDIIVNKLLSIAGLFITFAVIMAMFPDVNRRVSKEVNATQFGKDLLIGIVTLVFVPIIVIFLCISFIGAPAGVVLLVAYLASLYLAQAYSGLWLGKLLVEQLAHSKLNRFLELLLGVTIISVLCMIPWLGGYIWLLSTLLGLGLFMQSIKPKRGNKVETLADEEKEIEVEDSKKPEEKKVDKTSSKDKKED